MRQLMWFRTDLRLHDNTALQAAMQAGPTVAVFLLSPAQWQAHHAAASKVDFWLRNLAELKQSLASINVPLLIRTATTWDDAPATITKLCQSLKVGAVHVNTEYGVHESQRDTSVATQLAEQGTALHSHCDRLLFQPGSILTQTGSYFKVFSQFRKVCYQRLYQHTPACAAAPQQQAPLPIPADTVSTEVNGFPPVDAKLQAHWPAGENSAHQRLSRFASNAIDDYAHLRDFPAQAGTSQLSPYLAAGVLSIRQCLHAALAANQGEIDTGSKGVSTWINELLWREFYTHILVGYPKVSRHRAFKSATEQLAWRNAPDDLLAWQQGRTGFPLIDAAMRQLLATGWMHNRLRMVTAMFLSKNLFIDWRAGERFFMQHLIDGDLAANNGGWQWCASTGTDAVPYFRLFNPVSQAKKFDPQGTFIRHWLPELAHLKDTEIHQPQQLGGLFNHSNYPAPMLDLAASRARVLSAFKELPRAAP